MADKGLNIELPISENFLISAPLEDFVARQDFALELYPEALLDMGLSDSFMTNAVAGAILGMANVLFISDENADKTRPSLTPVERNLMVPDTNGF